MPDYALSEAADADIQAIVRNSVRQWGFPRAGKYILELHKAFERLSEFPNLGRDIGHIRPGYFRMEHESHSVYYQKVYTGVFIVRILHQKQQPKNYL